MNIYVMNSVKISTTLESAISALTFSNKNTTSSKMATICGKCFFQVNYHAGVTCDGCHRSFCLRCTSLSVSEVICLKTPSRRILYLCESCHHNLNEIPKLKYIISSFPAEIERVRCGPCALNYDLIASEVVERHRRSKNIVIYNLTECESSISKDIDLYDKISVMKIITHVFKTHETEPKIHRLGWDKPSVGTRPRPVLVSLESTEKARQILKYKFALKAKFLVTIGNDETPMQQAILSRLREELCEKKKTNSKLTIKYVRGCPRIVEMDLLDMYA